MHKNPSSRFAFQPNALTLQHLEPNALFAQWQLSEVKIDLIREHYGTDWQYMRPFLRLYDISGLSFDGRQAHELRQISVKGMSSCWIKYLKPGRTYVADLGIWNRQDQFLPLIRSDRITVASAHDLDAFTAPSEESFFKQSAFSSNVLLSLDHDHVSAYTVYTPVLRFKKQQNPIKKGDTV